MCLFLIPKFSLVKYLVIYFDQFFSVFGFSLLLFEASLYILNMSFIEI